MCTLFWVPFRCTSSHLVWTVGNVPQKTWTLILQGTKNNSSWHITPSNSLHGTFQNTEQIDLFLNLAKNDLKYMINQLLAYPNIRYLYAAGSITKKYYLIEFLRRFGGFSLNPVVPFERGGTGKIGLYTIDLGDGINRHLFFCSTSPSSRSNKDTLSQKASLLKTNYSEFLPSSW